MAFFDKDIASAPGWVDDDDKAQFSETNDTSPLGMGDPTLADGTGMQPGDGGLLRRIDLRLGSVT